MTYRTIIDNDSSILIDMSVLTATIDSSDGRLFIITGCSDGHFRLTGISAERFRIALFINIICRAKGYLTLAAAKDITCIIIVIRTYFTIARDGHRSLAVLTRIFRISSVIMELIRPTQTEAVRQICMLGHVGEITTSITNKVDKTYRCQFTTTINILLHRTARNIDVRVSWYTACP